MSVLSRQSIKRLCSEKNMVALDSGAPLKFEPVSIDLRLAEVKLDGILYEKGQVALKPGVFCLGSVAEIFKMPLDVMGLVVGKSTIAREGLQIEAAGLIDPGFEGHITLEFTNLHHQDWYTLTIDEFIGQVYFMWLDEEVDVPYGADNGNHYQGQRGVTPSHRRKN